MPVTLDIKPYDLIVIIKWELAQSRLPAILLDSLRHYDFTDLMESLVEMITAPEFLLIYKLYHLEEDYVCSVEGIAELKNWRPNQAPASSN